MWYVRREGRSRKVWDLSLSGIVDTRDGSVPGGGTL